MGARVASEQPLGNRAAPRLPSLRLAAPSGANRPAWQGSKLRAPRAPSGPPSSPSSSARGAPEYGLHLSLRESAPHGVQRRCRAGTTPGGSALAAASPMPWRRGRSVRAPPHRLCAPLACPRVAAQLARRDPSLSSAASTCARSARRSRSLLRGTGKGQLRPGPASAWAHAATSPALRAPPGPPGTPGRSPAQARACSLWRPSFPSLSVSLGAGCFRLTPPRRKVWAALCGPPPWAAPASSLGTQPTPGHPPRRRPGPLPGGARK